MNPRNNSFQKLSSILLIALIMGAVCAFGASDVRAESESDSVAAAIERLTAVTGAPPIQTTRILDRHGILLYEISDRGRRTVVALDQVPQQLIAATVATEDKNFFKHAGIDMAAIARAAYQNWQSDDIVSGASTISQQLARGLLMGDEERYELTMRRKLNEAFMAMDLEDNYTKEQILEMYLNTVYYGHQAYGIAAAAETYLQKPLSALTLGESALLAGLPQSPNEYDPIIHPEAAFGRQRVVLGLMQRQGYITAEERRAAQEEVIRVSPATPVLRAPHFVDYIREMLLERYGPEGMHQGLQIHTSLDLRFQQIAERIAAAQIAVISEKHRAGNAAVTILHPATGQILAMVGSIDYYNEEIDGQVNMAISPRQPGSSIKPVVYATALENGWSPASIIWDVPTTYVMGNGQRYVPRNSTGRYYGATRMRAALANSLNVPAIKTLEAVGIPAMLDTARKLGIESWRRPVDDYGLSLAVGGYEVTLLELTHAFATLANGGAYVPIQPITEITDGAGRSLFRAQTPDIPVQAVSPATAYQLSSMLSDNRMRQFVFGRNSALQASQPAAVKTGTTDDWRDNLTVGFTPYVTVGVWVGNSDSKRMRNIYGSQGAAPIWHDIMEKIWASPNLYPSLGYVGKPLPVGFEPPSGVYTAPVCDTMLSRYQPNCDHAYEEVFALPGSPNAPQTAAIKSQTRGYCVPALQADLPPSIYAQALFIPVPQRDGDRQAAQNWANRNNVRLATLADCNPTPVSRSISGQPEPAKAKAIIPIASLPKQKLGMWPGVRVAPSERSQGINIRSGPGQDQRIVGSARPRQIMVIRKGPEESSDGKWFQVKVLDTGLSGWVLGRLLTIIPPDEDISGLASTELVQSTGFRSGDSVRLKAGVEQLNLRLAAGLNNLVVGEAKPGMMLVVKDGPELVGNTPWYAVEEPELKLSGWVDGRYLQLESRPEPASVAETTDDTG
ncbi:MAG: PBP1A family penicillin-binding protein [Caldilineales bacterium]|nr:PBP1A family penicillin-binding protein [Caldilineales bacterium]